MTTEYEALRRELHAEIDRRIDAAQPKEWPQVGDDFYSAAELTDSFEWRGYLWQKRQRDMGLLARTKAEAEAIRDRVSAFNAIWNRSTSFREYIRDWTQDRASLTDAERKALEG